MIDKLYSLLVLAAVAVAYSQAGWDQYIGSVSTGVQGIQQRCFLQAILSDSQQRYRYESIAKHLGDDLDELKASAMSEVEKNPGTSHCYVYSHCRNFGQFSPREDSFRQEVFDARCFRLLKTKRLCELIKERKSLDKQLLAIEDWVCRVSAEQALENDYVTEERCMRSAREAAEREADKGFHQVALSTAEELERAKEAVKEVAVLDELQAKHDSKIAQEVRQLISDRFSKYFSDYKSCYEKTDADAKQVAIERQEAEAAIEAAKKHKKGLLGKISQCFGGSCN